MMMPPQAPSPATATSVVGVDAIPMFTTSKPMPRRVADTRSFTIGPDSRASRPTTMRLDDVSAVFLMKVAYAAVNFTMSSGLSPSPGRPPMVPRIPEIDFINDIKCENM